MLRRFLYALVLVAALCIPQAQAVPRAALDTAATQTKDCVVYVTRTGARYHKPTCSSLRRSRIPMTRSEAVARGYTPCKRCGGSDCER